MLCFCLFSSPATPTVNTPGPGSGALADDPQQAVAVSVPHQQRRVERVAATSSVRTPCRVAATTSHTTAHHSTPQLSSSQTRHTCWLWESVVADLVLRQGQLASPLSQRRRSRRVALSCDKAHKTRHTRTRLPPWIAMALTGPACIVTSLSRWLLVATTEGRVPPRQLPHRPSKPSASALCVNTQVTKT
jgi:hypothetical protein